MLTDFDKIIIGGNKRITIPMHDRFILRDVADALHGLANKLDYRSRMEPTKEWSERLIMMTVGFEIDHVNSLIRLVAQQAGVEIKEGRPSKAQIAAEKETAQSESASKIKIVR